MGASPEREDIADSMVGPTERLPLTLVVPAYERQAALDRALLSVAAQAERPAKVVVVDDGSPQRLTIPDECARRLSLELIRHPGNRGAAAARNTGLRAAETEWVSFLDSDDLLLDGSLARRWAVVAARLREGAPHTTVFGCGWVDFAAPAQPLGIRRPRPGRSVADFAAGCWFSPGSCVILNGKAAVEAAGFQDEALARFEDVDWFYALARRGFTLEVLPLVGVAIERSRSNRPVALETAAAALLDKWRGEPPPLRRRMRAYMALEIAAAHYFAGSKPKAALSLLRSFLRAPRLSLPLSPGWTREGPAAVGSATLSWFRTSAG